VKTRLRAALLRKAYDGNSRCLIFLARAELNMTESPHRIELSGPNGSPMRTENDGGAAMAAAEAMLAKLTAAARARPDEPFNEGAEAVAEGEADGEAEAGSVNDG
jgi:hypothetical protein